MWSVRVTNILYNRKYRAEIHLIRFLKGGSQRNRSPEKVKSFIKRERTTATHVDTIITDVNEVEQWEKDIFVDNVDSLTWMSNVNNLAKLGRDSLRNAEDKKMDCTLQGVKDFCIWQEGWIYKRNARSNSQLGNHEWHKKSIARYATIDSKRNELRRRLPNIHTSYSNTKTMIGKSYPSQLNYYWMIFLLH